MTADSAPTKTALMDGTFDVPAHVVARELEGELVLLDLESGGYFGLNPVGARIWEHVSEGASLQAVHTALMGEFDVDAGVLRDDLLELIASLEAAKLIEARS